MNDAQAEALSRILDPLVTRRDLSEFEEKRSADQLRLEERSEKKFAGFSTELSLLEVRMDAKLAELKAEMFLLEERVDKKLAEFRAEIMLLEERMDTKLAELKADLTWRMIAMTIFLATVMTLLNLFVN